MGENHQNMSDFGDELRSAEDLYEQMRHEIEIVMGENERIKDVLRRIVRRVEKLPLPTGWPEMIKFDSDIAEAEDLLR